MATFEFKGKHFVYAHDLSVPFRPLEIDPKKSLSLKGSNPTLDNNLIIHGDNLNALKALLPTYAGRVRCIFIDPPYNTGEEGWCYNDNVNSPLMREWIRKNAPVDKEDLERHDKWCCMMWPRLRLLKELLHQDGAIFITIDDTEVHRLTGMMDDIFGEGHHIATIVWQKKYSRDNRPPIGVVHDYILIYSNCSPERFKQLRTKIPADESQLKVYRNPNNDPRGRWRPVPMTAQAGHATKDQFYEIITPTDVVHKPPPGRCWSVMEPEYKRLLSEGPLEGVSRRGRIWFGKDGNSQPNIIRYLDEIEGFVPWTWWPHDEAGNTDESKKEILEIFGCDAFPSPKPVRLVKRILEMYTSPDSGDIILDSFAGSGTTAHAVLALNKADDGGRRFILIQIPETIDETHPAHKLGFNDVAHITTERIRRVMKGYNYNGTIREELYSCPMNFSLLKKADKILKTIEGIENLEENRFDRITKVIQNGTLKVFGEKKVTERAEGLGGSFTFCKLGHEISIQSLLTEEKLPDYEAIAKYVFYTATGQTLTKSPKHRLDWFIGETTNYRVHLIYKADRNWLRSNDAMLDAKKVDKIAQGMDKQKRTLVFAPGKFMSQKELTPKRIEFCQLPYAIYRILGD